MPLGDVHYADDYQPDFGIPYVDVLPMEQLATWPKDKLAE